MSISEDVEVRDLIESLGTDTETTKEETKEEAVARMKAEEKARKEREAIEREEVALLFEAERRRLKAIPKGENDDRINVIGLDDVVVPYDKINFELVGGKTIVEAMEEHNERMEQLDQKKKKKKKKGRMGKIWRRRR